MTHLDMTTSSCSCCHTQRQGTRAHHCTKAYACAARTTKAICCTAEGRLGACGTWRQAMRAQRRTKAWAWEATWRLAVSSSTAAASCRVAGAGEAASTKPPCKTRQEVILPPALKSTCPSQQWGGSLPRERLAFSSFQVGYKQPWITLLRAICASHTAEHPGLQPAGRKSSAASTACTQHARASPSPVPACKAAHCACSRQADRASGSPG